MQIVTQKIAPCLWFDTEAEEAAKFYVSVFKNSKINTVARYPDEGQDIHGKPAGSVMVVDFEIAGQKFVALTGGPQFTFDEAVSFQVYCESEDEVDYFWRRLTEGGKEGPCGWLKDRFGLSWQVVPVALLEMMLDRDASKSARVMAAFMQMKKFEHRGAEARLRRRGRLNSRREEDKYASSTLSSVRRPLRGGNRVLQERSWRPG
jgi:predicted 3-demethylubiquinone-9 3-methyltransferase (glyoxalase superfamily)